MKELLEKIYYMLKSYFENPEPTDLQMVPPEEPQQIHWAPTVIKVKGVKYSKHGFFKTKLGKALGAVVHYTVSGRTAANAIGVVKYLASKGLGCLVMDENGIFYCAENYDYMKDVVYHAGNSLWKGKSGISTYCIGLEICGYGSDGPKHGVKDLRTSTGEDNIKRGTYQMYTAKQEETLINFLKFCKRTNPEFSYDWVVGHDEIAPSRKSDPGASLSMTMPELRKLLKV